MVDSWEFPFNVHLHYLNTKCLLLSIHLIYPCLIKLFILIYFPILHITTVIILRAVVVLILRFAIALSMFCSTSVTKLKSTSACHVTASMIPLNPKLAFRTLLVVCTLHEVHKLFIHFLNLILCLVLFTCLVEMSLSFAFQTVTSLTFYTVKVCYVLTKFKCVWTTCSRTPTHVFRVFLHKIVQCKLIILFNQLLRKILFNILSFDVLFTLFKRAFQRKFFIQNWLFHALFKTLLMYNMPTSKDTNMLMFNFHETDRTFSDIAFASFQIHRLIIFRNFTQLLDFDLGIFYLTVKILVY